MRMGVNLVDDDVRRMLRRAQASISPTGMQKLFRRLGDLQVTSSFDNFDDEAFDGVPWERLSEATQSTGRDDANILHPKGTHIRRTISMEASPDYARVFTPTPWAHVHNEGADLHGTAFGDITIPRRTFLGISEEDQENIVTATENFIEDAFGM